MGKKKTNTIDIEYYEIENINYPYYIYAYLNPLKKGIYQYEEYHFNNEPFYIGKGKARRAYFHLTYVKRRITNKFNHVFLNTIRKILINNKEPEIVLIFSNLTEETAYGLEREIIKEIGLNNLTNIFEGGRGGRNNKNFYGRKHTNVAREKIRISKLGNKNPMFGDNYFRSENGKKTFKEKMSKENHHFFNKKRNDNVKKKISESLIGYKWSEQDKEKRSIGMKRVWEKRKKENIKIKRFTGKKIKAININNDKNIIFESQKECSKYFNIDFRTIRKYIENNKKLNNFNLLWI